MAYYSNNAGFQNTGNYGDNRQQQKPSLAFRAIERAYHMAAEEERRKNRLPQGRSQPPPYDQALQHIGAFNPQQQGIFSVPHQLGPINDYHASQQQFGLMDNYNPRPQQSGPINYGPPPPLPINYGPPPPLPSRWKKNKRSQTKQSQVKKLSSVLPSKGNLPKDREYITFEAIFSHNLTPEKKESIKNLLEQGDGGSFPGFGREFDDRISGDTSYKVFVGDDNHANRPKLRNFIIWVTNRLIYNKNYPWFSSWALKLTIPQGFSMISSDDIELNVLTNATRRLELDYMKMIDNAKKLILTGNAVTRIPVKKKTLQQKLDELPRIVRSDSDNYDAPIPGGRDGGRYPSGERPYLTLEAFFNPDLPPHEKDLWKKQIDNEYGQKSSYRVLDYPNSYKLMDFDDDGGRPRIYALLEWVTEKLANEPGLFDNWTLKLTVGKNPGVTGIVDYSKRYKEAWLHERSRKGLAEGIISKEMMLENIKNEQLNISNGNPTLTKRAMTG